MHHNTARERFPFVPLCCFPGAVHEEWLGHSKLYIHPRTSSPFDFVRFFFVVGIGVFFSLSCETFTGLVTGIAFCGVSFFSLSKAFNILHLLLTFFYNLILFEGANSSSSQSISEYYSAVFSYIPTCQIEIAG